MKKFLLLASLLLAACNSGGGSSSVSDQVPISGWTQFYGYYVGIDATGSFNFPNSTGSVHYIVEPHAATLGQTVTLKFQISGSGTWGISDAPSEGPPPTLHLFLWERGDDGTGQGVMETYREWCGRIDITSPGTYTATCVLNASNWTGVFGQTPSAANFQQLLNNLYGVGFTFGGQYFAGHGVYSDTGSFHFALISYTIQ